MEQKVLKKKIAFTLNEMMISMSVLAIIITMTSTAVIRDSNINEKNILLTSSNFYNNIYNSFSEITTIEAKKDNLSMRNMTSEQLRNYFLNHFDGVVIDCQSNFKNLELISSNKDNPACAKSSFGVNFAVVVDNDCNTTVATIEHAFEQHQDIKTINNACGYLAFKTKKSTETLGRDFFSIAFGKKSVK